MVMKIIVMAMVSAGTEMMQTMMVVTNLWEKQGEAQDHDETFQ